MVEATADFVISEQCEHALLQCCARAGACARTREMDFDRCGGFLVSQLPCFNARHRLCARECLRTHAGKLVFDLVCTAPTIFSCAGARHIDLK